MTSADAGHGDNTVTRVRTAFDVVLPDFLHPSPVELTITVGRQADDDLVWVSEPHRGGVCGFRVDDDAGDEELLVQVADFLQDQVFDLLDQTWGEARPPCPGHQHQLYATYREEQGWWRCPRTNELHARIGQLG